MAGSSLWLLPPKSHPLHQILTSLITTILPARFPEIVPIPPTATGTSSAHMHGMDSSFFPPHMTLTSGISPALYGSDPQAFLDSLPFSTEDPSSPPCATGSSGASVKVRFSAKSTGANDTSAVGNNGGAGNSGGAATVQSQDTFFRRCFIKVVLDETIRHLAGVARAKCVNGEDSETDPKTRDWLRTWEKEFGPHVSLIYGNIPISEETLCDISKVVEEAGVDLGGTARTTDGVEPERYNGWNGGVVWLVPTDRPVNEWKPIATRDLF